jgi:hypothetical protein
MAREAEMAAALHAPYEQVQARVRSAHAKNVDETGWRRAGRWLWVAATPTAALFHVDRGRNWHGLQNLLGELVQGTVCYDRHGTYERLKLSRRAVCWARTSNGTSNAGSTAAATPPGWATKARRSPAPSSASGDASRAARSSAPACTDCCVPYGGT